MRFELTTTTLAKLPQPQTAFGKFNNIHHVESRRVGCRPEVSRGKWKACKYLELHFSSSKPAFTDLVTDWLLEHSR
jgi:hypothetical protein